MKERSCALCYMFLTAVAASAVAVFLFPGRETGISYARNLSLISFIYYNYMVLNDPGNEKIFLAGRSLPFGKK
ncbi:MAG: hypothetical protein Q7R35_01945 [Elusimicrobiota bacterium]|nr:hypothetical protein [Elusimicrobiota bacterium]